MGETMSVCASCGNANADFARFCQSCGSALAGARPQPYRSVAGTYAGFWIRAVAFLLDWVFLAFVTAIAAVASAGPGFLAGVAIAWLYEALMLTSESQATLGKMALGIIVTDEAGGRLTFGQATGRHFAKYLSCLLLGIGFIMAALTARKQALHDMIAGTVAIRK